MNVISNISSLYHICSTLLHIFSLFLGKTRPRFFYSLGHRYFHFSLSLNGDYYFGHLCLNSTITPFFLPFVDILFTMQVTDTDRGLPNTLYKANSIGVGLTGIHFIVRSSK